MLALRQVLMETHFTHLEHHSNFVCVLDHLRKKPLLLHIFGHADLFLIWSKLWAISDANCQDLWGHRWEQNLPNNLFGFQLSVGDPVSFPLLYREADGYLIKLIQAIKVSFYVSLYLE